MFLFDIPLLPSYCIMRDYDLHKWCKVLTRLRIKLAVSASGLLFIIIGLAVITTARTGGGIFSGLILYLPGLLLFFAPWAGWFLRSLFPRIEREVPPWMEDSYRRVRPPKSGDRGPTGQYWQMVKAIILKRPLLIAAGTFFVGLGFIGIFVPLLPTVPFLLLAAACYARSSERFSNWLLNNRLFGKAIRDYREGKGVPPRTKAVSIALLWLTIVFSIAFAVHLLAVKVILILIATGVTIHILTIRPLRQLESSSL